MPWRVQSSLSSSEQIQRTLEASELSASLNDLRCFTGKEVCCRPDKATGIPPTDILRAICLSLPGSTTVPACHPGVADRDIDSIRTLGCSGLRLTHDFQQFLWSNRLNKMGVEACRGGAFAGYFIASCGNRHHQQRVNNLGQIVA
jgi:hypothetical protein